MGLKTNNRTYYNKHTMTKYHRVQGSWRRTGKGGDCVRRLPAASLLQHRCPDPQWQIPGRPCPPPQNDFSPEVGSECVLSESLQLRFCIFLCSIILCFRYEPLSAELPWCYSSVIKSTLSRLQSVLGVVDLFALLPPHGLVKMCMRQLGG